MPFSTPLFGPGRARKRAAEEAYSGLLKAALSPRLYVEFGVPDTFAARASAVTLTTALVCHRIASEPAHEARPLTDFINRRVLDGFDAAFREQGVGDASIARKVRKLAETHSGLGRAVLAALQNTDPEVAPATLPDILVRNGVTGVQHAAALSALLLETRNVFADHTGSEPLVGLFDWSGFTGEADQGVSISPVA